MKISKVKLVDRGIKGIEVSFMKQEDRGKMVFNDEYVVKYKAPVNTELRESFTKLHLHLREICGVSKELDVDVRGLNYNGEAFLISGVVTTVLNEKVYGINTPLINADDDYVKYDSATSLMDKIYEEVRKYVSERKMMNPKQFVMEFAENKGKLDDYDFENMSDSEALSKAREILEKSGAIVITQDDTVGPIVVDMTGNAKTGS